MGSNFEACPDQRQRYLQQIRQRKNEIQQLERLAGTIVIFDADGHTAITAYRAGKKKIRYQTYR